jgi:hypothetical protein
MSVEKWSIEEGWILCKMDGLQYSMNGPQFKRGTTAASFADPSANAESSAAASTLRARISKAYNWPLHCFI